MKFNIIRFKPVLKFLQFTKSIVLPGFDGLSLYTVASFFFQGIFQGSITTRASSVAFSFFMAVFPMIIAFFTLIPFVPIENFQETLLNILDSVLPDQVEPIVHSTVVDIISRPRRGLLSVTFVMAIIFATNGFHSIIEAFNNTYHTIETRSWFKQKLVSTLLFFIISIIIILSIVLLVAGDAFINLLYEKEILTNQITFYLVEITRWIVLLSMFFFTISFIYYLAPAKVSKFRFISAGSTLATILSLMASVGFNFYVKNFSNYNALYGSIGTLLIILFWIYFNSIILLIGFELNASIQQAGKKVGT